MTESPPTIPAPEGALVLFSGGQDSTTTLAWALDRFQQVETIGFDYRQRHRVELDVRPAVLARLRTIKPGWDAALGPDHLVDLGVLAAISDTALTSEAALAWRADSLPNTFVPGRNLLFLTFAAAVASRRGLRHLVAGVCETDFSGYPDCRDDTIKAMQVALNLGMNSRMVIHTPLMWIDKAATWRLAEALGGDALVALIRDETHTCYIGERGERHAWGFGCGTCPACDLRAKGWATYAAAGMATPAGVTSGGTSTGAFGSSAALRASSRTAKVNSSWRICRVEGMGRRLPNRMPVAMVPSSVARPARPGDPGSVERPKPLFLVA